MRRHWAPLACPRVTDVIRRLHVEVVAPETSVKPSVLLRCFGNLSDSFLICESHALRSVFECHTEFMVVLLDARGPIARGGAINIRTDLVLDVISTTLQCGVASVSVQCSSKPKRSCLLRCVVVPTEATVDPAGSVTVHETSPSHVPESST